MPFHEDFPRIRVIAWGILADRPVMAESKQHVYVAYDIPTVYISDNNRNWVDVNQLATGDFTVSQTLTVLDTANAPIILTPRSTEPTPVLGAIYLDDGTNTLSGNLGLRGYDGAVWRDL